MFLVYTPVFFCEILQSQYRIQVFSGVATKQTWRFVYLWLGVPPGWCPKKLSQATRGIRRTLSILEVYWLRARRLMPPTLGVQGELGKPRNTMIKGTIPKGPPAFFPWCVSQGAILVEPEELDWMLMWRGTFPSQNGGGFLWSLVFWKPWRKLFGWSPIRSDIYWVTPMAWQHEEWFPFNSLPAIQEPCGDNSEMAWYNGLGVMSEAFHEKDWKSQFFDSNSFWMGIWKKSLNIVLLNTKKTHKGGDMVQWRPKLLFSHPRIPWVGLTDDSLVHLMQRWRVERAKLLATRDSKGLPGNSRADGSRKSNFITKKNGMNFFKKNNTFWAHIFHAPALVRGNYSSEQTKN